MCVPVPKVTSKSACLACRLRKVRCIPATPRCQRCTELGIDECLYLSVKKRGSGNTLRMGEACQPCRKRKRRCDAKQPCTPCSKDEGSDCIYERRRVKPMHERRPAAAQTSESKPNPSRSLPSRVNSEDPSPPSDTASPDTSRSVLSLTDRTPSISSTRECRFSESDTLDELEPPVLRERAITELKLVPFQEYPNPPQLATTSIYSVLQSLRFSSVPRPLHTSLSFLGPEHFQVSDTTSSELDLTLWAFPFLGCYAQASQELTCLPSRLAALLRLRLFGIYLPGPKQDAVLRGDVSNTIVSPFFVHASAGLGMYFCAGVGHSPRWVQIRVKHAQRAFEQITEISGGSNADLTVQVSFSLTVMTLYSRWLDSARKCLTTTCVALNAAGLQFIPATGHPPGLTEDVQPIMTVRIEKEFRYDLQETYPHLFDICPLTMRTQGILLVNDAILMTALRSADGMRPDQWEQMCDGLVTRLDKYSDTLLQNMRTFLQVGDTQGAEIIQSNCVGCLAHLAVLYDLISCSEPNSKPRMDTICDSSLERLSHLTQEMSIEEYTYFDLLLKASWERSLAVFDSRISFLSQEESVPLRRYRGIVAEALSDIEARLPGPSPPRLSTNSVFADGRDEGSKYPNFMVASERARLY